MNIHRTTYNNKPIKQTFLIGRYERNIEFSFSMEKNILRF